MNNKNSTRVIALPMAFNRELFRMDVRTMMVHCGLTIDNVDALVGKQVVRAVLSEAKTDYMPTLRNYLRLCNELDLDPRRYFHLVTNDENQNNREQGS